jgi:2-haloacid dehalogenase
MASGQRETPIRVNIPRVQESCRSVNTPLGLSSITQRFGAEADEIVVYVRALGMPLLWLRCDGDIVIPTTNLSAHCMTIRALVFDAYGTLYDTQSVSAKAEELCPGNGEVIAQLWRLKQLEYTWLRALLQDYADFWEVTRAALDFALKAARVEPSDSIRAPLMDKYLHLDPYPEAPEALAALAAHRLAILSNGSPRMLDALVRNSGLDRWIEAVISVDAARTYKPHPSCYALVEQRLRVTKEEVLFVSSNGFDVVGAKAFGFNVAWIRRSGGATPSLYAMLRSRAEELGHASDHLVSSLTDLQQLL